MADGPKEIEVPGSWIGTEDLPVHFANAFVGVAYVPIKPIARFALAPDGLDDLITVLESMRENYQNLRRAMEDQEGS